VTLATGGPPASARQIAYLLALVQKAGHGDFKEARIPLGLTQRQAEGKFTSKEASALIDVLVANEGELGDGPTGAQLSAAQRLEAERATLLAGMPANLMVEELERRGWTVSPPR
jgi:hypothetical protein